MRTLRDYSFILLFIAGLWSGCAFAQSYPTKPIRIMTTGAGGGSDFLARLVAGEITGPLGQPIVVENRPAGPVLFSAVAKAAPDGYTLLVTGGALWTIPLLGEVPYDAVRDFAPITILTLSPNVLIVHASLPALVAEVIKMARAQPGKLNYSSGTNGSSSHIAAELFKTMADLDIVRVAYKEQAAQTVDSVSGQVQMTFGQGAVWTAQIKAGKLRALATGGARRSPLYPDLPTVSETLPGFISEQVQTLFATGKTPDAIIRRLNQETARGFNKAEVREQLLKNGQESATGTPEQLADYVRADLGRMETLVKAGVMKPAGS